MKEIAKISDGQGGSLIVRHLEADQARDDANGVAWGERYEFFFLAAPTVTMAVPCAASSSAGVPLRPTLNEPSRVPLGVVRLPSDGRAKVALIRALLKVVANEAHAFSGEVWRKATEAEFWLKREGRYVMTQNALLSTLSSPIPPGMTEDDERY